MKKLFVLLAAGLLAGGAAKAQPLRCGTDQNRLDLIKKFPQILEIEAKLEKEMKAGLENGSLRRFAKGSAVDADTVYHVPVVFHVVHDYGPEYVTDDQIFEAVADMNRMYSRTNPLTFPLAPSYAGNIPGTNIQYRGLANIQFHLATKDPEGKPTRGITRTRSPFANNAGDNAKIDQWAPNSYVNIWLIHTFSGAHSTAAAYAIYPSAAEVYPYGDGIITIVQPPGNPFNNDHTISHEMGHVLNLIHTFGNNNGTAGSACGDDDVDDTPPSKVHGMVAYGCVPLNIYDTTCALGYQKTYSPISLKELYGHYNFNPALDSLYFHPLGIPGPIDTNNIPTTINYPDTTNGQNVMDYSYCSQMFTYGQTQRMRRALKSPTGGRSNLITPSNLFYTGVTDASGNFVPLPDLAPTADYTPSRVFVCADGQTSINFTNRSWNDTIVAANWTFGNGASTPTSTNLGSVNNVTFTTPGWLQSSLTVTGNNNNNTGTAHLDSLVYVADPAGVNPNQYMQSFDANTDLDKWPIFNYYAKPGASNYVWKVINTNGFTDNTSMEFMNYDPRPFATSSNQTATPEGIYADFFSRAFDLSGASNYHLSFAYAGAYRTTNPNEMNDRFEVAYSDDCGVSFNTLPDGVFTKGTLGNNGYVSAPFYPGPGKWAWKSMDLTGIGGSTVYFRFRYKVGTGDVLSTQLGTGNNFYLDRIAVNNYALGVDPQQLEAQGIVLSPNPTSGASTITVKGGDNSTALVHVTDVTGKLVFSTSVRLNATATSVEIPADRIAVKGLYMVEVIANGKPMTQKLVVY